MIKNTRISCLHESPEQFDELIARAANHFGMDEPHIEKDYWITRVLKQISLSEYKDNVYFKGGTCLFKAYGIIKRFSEDLDLYVDTNNPASGGDPERKLNGKVFHYIIEQNKDIHCDDPMNPDEERGLYNRTSLISNRTQKDSGLKQYLQIETTISSIKRKTPIYQPYESREITSIIGKYLEETGEGYLPVKYRLGPFQMNCIRPEKTLCDKLSRMIRLSFEEDPISSIAKAIRDVYDIHCLMHDPETAKAVTDRNFEDGLILTFEQDRLQHKYPHIAEDFTKTKIFYETEELFSNSFLVDSYQKLDKLLFDRDNNKLPDLSSVIETLKSFRPIIERVQEKRAAVQKNIQSRL